MNDEAIVAAGKGKVDARGGVVIGSPARPGARRRSLKVPGSTARLAVCVSCVRACMLFLCVCVCVRVSWWGGTGRGVSIGWTDFESSNLGSLFWGLLN